MFTRKAKTLFEAHELIQGAVLAWIILLGVAVLIYNAALGVKLVELNMNDFGKFYYSARHFLDGNAMYAPSPATSIPVSDTEAREFLNLNPPHFHILILPLALLGASSALLVWTLVNLLCCAVSLRWIIRELRPNWNAAQSGLLLLALVACAATGAIVLTAQVSFLLLLPVTMAWTNARRGNWWRAGVYLGVCASMKPFLGIFMLYFLGKRHWKPAIAMSAAGGAAGLLGIAIFGVSAYQSWLAALSAVSWPWAAMNGSLAGFLARTFAENPMFTPAMVAPFLGGPLAVVLSLIVGLVSLTALLGSRLDPAPDYAFALLLVTALLVSPLGWIYYLWLPIGPLAGIVTSWKREHTGGSEHHKDMLRRCRNVLLFLTLPGLFCPLIVTTVGQPSPWATVTTGSAYFWTTLFLWAALLVDWRRHQRLSLPIASTKPSSGYPALPLYLKTER